MGVIIPIHANREAKQQLNGASGSHSHARIRIPAEAICLFIFLVATACGYNQKICSGPKISND
jgi:hypothetical protein